VNNVVCFIEAGNLLLDLIDGLLGIVVLIFIFVLLKKLYKEIRERRKINREGVNKPERSDLIISDAGITMADGGKPIGEGSDPEKDAQLYISKNGILRRGNDRKPDKDASSQAEKS
jgi:hypothetical protein